MNVRPVDGDNITGACSSDGTMQLVFIDASSGETVSVLLSVDTALEVIRELKECLSDVADILVGEGVVPRALRPVPPTF